MNTYSITYSVGTNRHDESRYVASNIPENRLNSRIASIIAKGNSIYSVKRTISDVFD